MALPHAGLRKLEIAKALATDPLLLLLDEPFAGLTPAEVEELSGLLRDLREEGRTLVVVDHNMRGLMRLVDRVVVLYFGQKLAEGTPEQVAQNPAVQEAYLAGSGAGDETP
jgi:branched-chain amino acid transport system ATP-binding protein